MSYAEVNESIASEWPRSDGRTINTLQIASRAFEKRRGDRHAPTQVPGQTVPTRGNREGNPSVVVGPNTYNNIEGLFQSYAGMAYMLPFEMLDFIELLAIYNPDYSQAVENMRTLANPGHTLIIDGTKGVQKEVHQRIQDKNKQIQHRHGGIEGLIDKLLWQAAVYGAMAGEWVPNEDMTDIVDFIDVNPKTIRFFWENEATEDPFQVGPHWAPYQYATVRQVEEARERGQLVKNGCYLKLNEVTFQYFAFSAAPNSPYGVPPFLAALNNIAIQRDMMNNMASVVKKLALLGLIDVEVQQLKPTVNEDPSAFAARATQYLQGYADMVMNAMEDGGVVHFDDSKVNSQNLSGNAAGATNIFTQNEEQVFSGLKSMPSVQGRSYCVVPETRVLTADLHWVVAGDLELGEELIGFDEDLGKGSGRDSTTRYRSATVEVNKIIKQPCYKVTTDKGKITVSASHPFVGRHRSQTDRRWFEAQELVVGDRLIWLGKPWSADDSCDPNYLAGTLDIYATVQKIEYVGVKEVVALQTSARTFISEGLMSHNSTTETYAGVAYDIMIRQSLRYQRAARLMIEYGYNLMCMLWGVKVKDIKVHFHENKALQRLQIAQAEHTEIINELMKWAAGVTNQVHASHRLGYSEPATPLEQVPSSPWFSSGVATSAKPPFADAPDPEGDKENPTDQQPSQEEDESDNQNGEGNEGQDGNGSQNSSSSSSSSSNS